MSSIKIINADNKLKYYMPCRIPLIFNSIVREGLPIYLNLLTNQGLPSVPNYYIDKNGNPFSNVSFSWKLGYDSVLSILGVSLDFQSFDTYEEGIKYVKEQINANKDVIVSVTTYYLPYSVDYLNHKYIEGYPNPLFGVSDHSVSVTDISDDEIKIYDTTPRVYHGWINISDFRYSWMGNKGIEELKSVDGINNICSYGYCIVRMSKRFLENEIVVISLRLLKTITHEYLKGSAKKEGTSTYYFGFSANKKLLADIIFSINNKDQYSTRKFHECLIEHKICRFFFRDFYEDVCILYDQYSIYLDDVRNIAFEAEKIFTRLDLEISRDTINFKKLNITIDRLKNIFAIEKMIFEKIHLLTYDSTILEKRI